MTELESKLNELADRLFSWVEICERDQAVLAGGGTLTYATTPEKVAQNTMFGFRRLSAEVDDAIDDARVVLGDRTPAPWTTPEKPADLVIVAQTLRLCAIRLGKAVAK